LINICVEIRSMQKHMTQPISKAIKTIKSA
jgi:hypothetical protein